MLIDDLLFEAWAKDHPEEIKVIMERDQKIIKEEMKKRLDALKRLREEEKRSE